MGDRIRASKRSSGTIVVTLVAGVAAGFLVPILGGSTPAMAQPALGTAVKVVSPDTGIGPSLPAVSCTSAGNCVGVGYYEIPSGNYRLMAATQTSGTWSQATQLTSPSGAGTGDAQLFGVSCTSVGNCTAVGGYHDSSGNVQATAVTETAGTWATALSVTPPSGANSNPQAQLLGVSCTSPGNCAAVGTYRDSADFQQAMVAAESSGTWGQAVEITLPAGARTSASPEAELMGASCPSAGSCVAVGLYVDSSANVLPMTAVETDSSWAHAVEANTPSDASAQIELRGVSCTSTTGSCTAVGDYLDTSGDTQAMALTETGGTWGTAAKVSLPGDANANPLARLDSVSCTSAGTCSATGGYRNTTPNFEPMAATESSGTWGTAVKITPPPDAGTSNFGLKDLQGVSCSTATDCSAVGTYNSGSESMAATETGGTWSAATRIVAPDTVDPAASLNGVSCTSAGNCAAAGNYQDAGGNDQVMAAPEIGGAWGQGAHLTLPTSANVSGPLPNMNGISCDAAGSCAVVGDYVDNSSDGQAMAATEAGGVWSQAVKVTAPAGANSNPRASLKGVACTSAGNCVAVGRYEDSSSLGQPMVATETGGTWGQAQEITVGAAANRGATAGAILYGVSCSSAGNCTAVGDYVDGSGNFQAMAVTETGGTWGQAVKVGSPSNAGTDPFGQLNAVSCTSAGNCTAVGNYSDSSFGAHVMAATETNGTWAQAGEVTLPTGASTANGFNELLGVSCPTAGNCVGVGRFGDSSHHYGGMAAYETNGAWAQAVSVTSPADADPTPTFLVGLNAVSCTSDGGCSAVGGYEDSLNRGQAMAAGASGAPPAQETLTVTPAGTGTGTVTSDTGGISCPGTCSAQYSQGTQVTLTATASNGSTFTGWSGSGGCTGTGTCQISMNAAEGATATFTAAGNGNNGGNNGGNNNGNNGGGVVVGGGGGTSTTNPPAPTDNPPPATGPCVSPTGSAAFLCAAYQKLLGRNPDPAGFTTYLALLDGGATPTQVAHDIVTSAEYRADLVEGWYQSFLGGPADPSGLQLWTNHLANGATDQSVEAGIASSPEFYADAGGTNAGFIGALYSDVLGRAVDPAGLQAWESALSGGMSRLGVALGILNSGEGRAHFVGVEYQQLLGRPADTGGVAGWVGQLASGATDEDVVAGLVGSPEFASDAGG